MSSFTIENLLRQSDETPRRLRYTINSKRSATTLEFQRHDHVHNIGSCETTVLHAEPDKTRDHRFCNLMSVGKGRSAFTVIPFSREGHCRFGSICDLAACEIVTHRSRWSKSHNTNLTNSQELNPQTHDIDRYPVDQESYLDRQGHSTANGDKRDARLKQEQIGVKYEWMINPRPFYRKDGKKQKQDEAVLKRDRATFNTRQRNELERQFQLSKYPPRYRRINLAHYLELSEFQVKVWFQNRRMKHKKWKNAEKQSEHDDLLKCYCGFVAK